MFSALGPITDIAVELDFFAKIFLAACPILELIGEEE
jgi:hypothetical protein